jgi:hypothetical protein
MYALSDIEDPTFRIVFRGKQWADVPDGETPGFHQRKHPPVVGDVVGLIEYDSATGQRFGQAREQS